MAGTWNGDHLERLRRRLLAEGLLRAGLFLQQTHMNKLNVSNPRPHKTPAPLGDYPRKRTGWLQRHVLIEPSSIAEVEQTLKVRIGVGASAFYGEVLALRGWKGIRDTAALIREQLAEFVVRES
jgi:hypothetical protein